MSSSDKGSNIYQACLLAISMHKSKLHASSGKVALLYQGSTKSGDVWKTVELRQKAFEERMGFTTSYELLTDGLRAARIPVHFDGKTATLDVLLLKLGGLFRKGEADDLWSVLSALWVQNNEHFFIYYGASADPETIFKDVELPLLQLKNNKTAELKAQMEKALEAIERNEPLERELAEVEKYLKAGFRTFAKAIKRRQKLMANKVLKDDKLDALYDVVSKLSKLAH